MAESENAASPGSPRAMAEAASPPQPNSPTARAQDTATLGGPTLHVDTSSSREEEGVQPGGPTADVDNPTSESNDPSGGEEEEEEEEEEFRYDTAGQTLGDASLEPQEVVSPTTSTGSPQSPQSAKSPYSKWDPRHDEYAHTTAAAAAASGSTEVSPPLETPPAPNWSSASSPVMVSAPDSPTANVQSGTRGEAKPVQTSDVAALRARTRNVLKNLVPWLPQASQPTSAPAKMSTAQSAIKAVEARMQKPVHYEAPTPEPRRAPSAVHPPPRLVLAQTDKTRPHLSAPAPSPSLSLPSSPSSETDAVTAKLKCELESAEKRSQQLLIGLRNERSARAKVEEERNRLKMITISLRRSSEHAEENKRAREAAETQVAQLRTSLQERDKELEQTRTVLANREKDVERLEVERTEAIRDIVRTEDELNGRIVEDGAELIGLREQVVALLIGQTELQEEVDQLTGERDSHVARLAEASTDFQRLKAAMIRMRANHEAQLQAKEAELAVARQAAEQARVESSEISSLPAKLQSLVHEADSATKALRRHLKAVMLDLGPVACHADDDETGILSKSTLLKLVDRADTIFATRAALVLPQPYNASLSTAAWEHGEPPLQQLNKLQTRYTQLRCRHEEAENANAKLMAENARLRKESVEMHKAVVDAHKLIEEYSSLYA